MNKINIQAALKLLKVGRNLNGVVIEDIATAKVAAMDALLLAENGYAVPENNITYEDSQIEYDPDFDEIEWGKPMPFQKMQEILNVARIG